MNLVQAGRGLRAALALVLFACAFSWAAPASAERLYAGVDSDSGQAWDADTFAAVFGPIELAPNPGGVNEILVSPDGSRVYTANGPAHDVSVVNANTGAIQSVVTGGTTVSALALSPDGSRLYIGHSASFDVYVMDTATNTIVAGPIATGSVTELEVTPDGSTLYVGDAFNPVVNVIDTTTLVAAPDVVTTSAVEALDITADGTRVYAMANGDVEVIDTGTNMVVDGPNPVAVTTGDIELMPDGSVGYVPESSGTMVRVLDLGTNMVTDSVSVGTAVQDVALNAAGTRAFASNFLDDDISVIDTATNTLAAPDIATAAGPDELVVGPNPFVAPPPPPSDPDPVAGQSVNLEKVSGTVTAKCGGGGFKPVTTPELVQVGCLVDARRGTVRLTSDDGAGGEQTADFWAGLFRVKQKAGAGQYTELQLAGGLARCGKAKKRAAAAGVPIAAAAGARGRGLWGSGNGRFRTRGGRGAATVRGTIWFVGDQCDGSTVFRVKQGVVQVRDDVKGKNVTVRAGGRYVARPKGRR